MTPKIIDSIPIYFLNFTKHCLIPKLLTEFYFGIKVNKKDIMVQLLKINVFSQ